MAQDICEAWMGQWEKIVKKAWDDDGFKKRLLENPEAVLKEQGLPLEKGVQVKVTENTSSVVNLTLPAKPSAELSEEDLLRVAGGAKGVGGAVWAGSKINVLTQHIQQTAKLR